MRNQLRRSFILLFGLSVLNCTSEVLVHFAVVQVLEAIQCALKITNQHVFSVALSFEVLDDFVCVVVHNSYHSRARPWTGQAGSLTINPPVPGFQGPPEGFVNLI